MEEKIMQDVDLNEEKLMEEDVESAPFVVDEPAFAEEVTGDEELIQKTGDDQEESSDLKEDDSLDAEEETPENVAAEADNEDTKNEEFNINILINNNGPIDNRVAKKIAQKVLRDNVGYKGRFVAKFVDAYTAKSTGDNVVILNRIQISFGRQFSLTLPITVRVNGDDFEGLEDLTHADLVSFDGEIAESTQVNETSGRPYMTISEIHNVEIVSRGFAYQREHSSKEEA